MSLIAALGRIKYGLRLEKKEDAVFYAHDRQEKKWNPGQVNTDRVDSIKAGPLDKYWVEMFQYLSDRGLSAILASTNGWYPIHRKGLRIYIPATTRIPNHVYWQARGIWGQDLRYDSPYGPRRDALVVVKSKVPGTIACVVEGPMDALAMAELTGVTGIALMGLSPPQEALDHLVALCQEYEQVFCLPDKADIDGMFKIQNYLSTRGIMSTCKVPLDRKDVACYSLRERRELISE